VDNTKLPVCYAMWHHKDGKKAIACLSGHFKSEAIFMMAWEGQYKGNLIDELIETVRLATIRRIADEQRACIHCGEQEGNHSNFGSNCPNRAGHGPLYLETIYE
jgi:hypothetical protein